jgi:hypothetical protein
MKILNRKYLRFVSQVNIWADSRNTKVIIDPGFAETSVEKWRFESCIGTNQEYNVRFLDTYKELIV